MKKILATALSALMALCCLSMVGCENAALKAYAAGAPVTETAVTFDKTAVTLLQGGTAEVTAKTKGGDSISFVSLNAEIAEVSANGNKLTVTAKKPGVTYIVAVNGKKQYNAVTVTVDEANSGMEDSVYNLDTYIYPYWCGNTVYNETALFLGKTDGSPLLYPATKILKVSSYDLKTVYEEGKDYVYDSENNLLRRTENSSMPYMDRDKWYTSETTMFPMKGEIGKYLYFQEGNDICNRQVVISYEHGYGEDTSWDLPKVNKSAFPKLKSKLENGENVSIVYYGDSVTVGANASGFINTEPHAEKYADMMTSYMRKRYPNANITAANGATGGDRSLDGVAKFDSMVAPHNPDFLLIAYGLNDLALTLPSLTRGMVFAQTVQMIVDAARELNPDVEILLVSNMIGNPESTAYLDDGELEDALWSNFFPDGKAEYEGLEIAEVNKMHRQLYHRKGNRYRDITGNNINHPNDFASRVYAMTCLSTIFGYDYYKY